MSIAVGFWAAAALALPACGARTGLTIPDASFDTPPDTPDSPDSGPVCMPGSFPLTPTSADVVFTIDRSGSMALTIDGVDGASPDLWRWAILRRALAGAFSTLDPRVNLGAKFYPDPITVVDPSAAVACRTSMGIDVPVSPTGATQILTVFDRTDPIGGTPTALALGEASRALRARTSPRRFIVLTTDGAPNCNGSLDPATCVCTATGTPVCSSIVRDPAYSCLDDSRTIDVIRAAASIGIPVFVVGIEDPTRPDLADFMDEMAVAGGRPRSGTPRRFYAVRSEADLRDALDVITSSISQCGFVSPSVPSDESTFSLELDGVPVPRSDADGWAWTDRSVGELELFGTWCERVTAPGSELVAIVDTCGDR